MPSLTRRLSAEALGTFGFVFVGAAVVVVNGGFPNSGIGLIGIALAHAIALSVMITAEASTCQVRLNFTNFDALGTISKVTGPAQFNEALFDEIGRYIAREPSNLFREDLPDDYRRQLQHKIQQEQMRRKWEQKLAVQQQEELERLKREKSAADEAGGGFFGKVRELFRKI